jgi:peptidoglycan/LPS O-acetylase OafA/YrhL
MNAPVPSHLKTRYTSIANMRHSPNLAVRPVPKHYLPSLDGARGVAIICVLLDHMSSSKVIPFHCLRGVGHIGVYLFFSLSAFLLTVPFCLDNKERLTLWNTWGAYFFRRILRIYPLYIIVLLGKHFADAGFTWRNVWEHLLLRRGDGVFWTIQVETQYYIVLPLMIVTLFLAWRRNAVTGTLCTIGFYIIVHVLLHAVGKWWSLDGHSLRDYLWVFLSGSAGGALFALTASHPTRGRQEQWICETAAIVSLIIIIFAVPELFAMLPHPLWLSFSKMTLLSGVPWAVFIFAHLRGLGYVRAVLKWSPLRFLGLISYSLYLWHKQVITGVWRLREYSALPLLHYSWITYFISILICILVAGSVSYFLVERPFSRLKAGFTRRI